MGPSMSWSIHTYFLFLFFFVSGGTFGSKKEKSKRNGWGGEVLYSRPKVQIRFNK